MYSAVNTSFTTYLPIHFIRDTDHNQVLKSFILKMKGKEMFFVFFMTPQPKCIFKDKTMISLSFVEGNAGGQCLL